MSGSFLILTRIAERGCRFLNEILKSCEECASPPVLLRRGHSGGAYYQVLLGFPGMAPQSKKKQTAARPRNSKITKTWQDPTVCHYSPPLACAILFFAVFCFLLFQEFLEENQKPKNKKHKKQNTRPSSLLMLLPGVCNLVFFFVFFGSPRIFVKHKKGKTSKQKINSTVTRPMCFSTGHTCRSCYCLLMPAIPVPQFKVAGCVDSACTCCHCGFSR